MAAAGGLRSACGLFCVTAKSRRFLPACVAGPRRPWRGAWTGMAQLNGHSRLVHREVVFMSPACLWLKFAFLFGSSIWLLVPPEHVDCQR